MKRSIQVFTTIMTVIFCLGFSRAQDSDVGGWYMYLGNNKISKNINWHNEIQYRNYNWGGDLEQLLLRTGFGYNLTENNNNLLLGYGYISSRPYIDGEKQTINENRIFQQFVHKFKINKFHFQNRYRLEERFIEDIYKTRFRFMMGVTLPLNHKDLREKTLYLIANDELFINFKSPLFDRNRYFAGLGYKINKYFRVEAGYLVQAYENDSRGQFQLTFGNSMPFYKSE